MSTDGEIHRHQDVSGETVRASMGTYIEVANLHGGVEQLRPLLDQSAIDDLCVINEENFAERFGFSVASRAARAEIIRQKNAFALTPREVRLAKMAGAIRVRGNVVRFTSTAWMIPVGWIQIGLVGSVGVVSFVTLIWKHPSSMRAIAGLSSVSLVSAFAVALMYLFYVRANKLFRAQQ